MLVLTIFINVILPIFVIIGAGVALDRAFKLDLPTLSKLNFYIFVPALCFVLLLKSDINWSEMSTVAIFALIHAAILFALGWAACSFGTLREHKTVVTLGTVLSNVGNYGIPLILLAFGNGLIGTLAVLIVIQNILTFTLGIWMMERHHHGGAGTILASMAKIPIIYAVVIALLLRAFNLSLPKPLLDPLTYLSNGMVAIALLTLGVQLARTRLTHFTAPLSALMLIRLLVAPLLAAGLVTLFTFTPTVSKMLIVQAGFPVGVNLFILSAEYQRDEELSSQAVFLTTLLSAVTMAVLLAVVRR